MFPYKHKTLYEGHLVDFTYFYHKLDYAKKWKKINEQFIWISNDSAAMREKYMYVVENELDKSFLEMCSDVIRLSAYTLHDFYDVFVCHTIDFGVGIPSSICSFVLYDLICFSNTIIHIPGDCLANLNCVKELQLLNDLDYFIFRKAQPTKFIWNFSIYNSPDYKYFFYDFKKINLVSTYSELNDVPNDLKKLSCLLGKYRI